MAPIRIAIVGLSSAAKTSWAAEAHLPYLLSNRGKQHYEIVALLNSSTKAAEAARDHFNLPPSVRTYGDPESLAADPNIDLVVVSTRVDTHDALAKPSLEAGKAVFIEWPVAASATASRALLDPGTISTAYQAALKRSVVGLQGQVTPILATVKAVLDSGRVGKVLSSEVRFATHIWPRDALPRGLAYFADRSVGGNPLTISYGHVVDYVQYVLGGDFDAGSVKATSFVQRPRVGVLGDDAGTPVRTVTNEVPDFVAVHGHLRGGRRTVPGAPLAITMLTGPAFKGRPAFEWTIAGEKGEILLTSPDGPYLFSGFSFGVRPRIEVHDHATDEVEEVAWEWEDWQEELGLKVRSTAGVYERYARWWEGGQLEGELKEEEAWPRLVDAQKRMEHIEKILEQFDVQARKF